MKRYAPTYTASSDRRCIFILRDSRIEVGGFDGNKVGTVLRTSSHHLAGAHCGMFRLPTGEFGTGKHDMAEGIEISKVGKQNVAHGGPVNVEFSASTGAGDWCDDD